jgi:predicted ATPase
VRMAIHSGTASERDGDYFGPALNRCAHLLAVANGGQVLLTEATHGMVKDHPPTGASFRDLGSHRLRDLSVSERVFAVVHSDLASTQAIRSLSVLPNNLPVQLTTFVGRAQELEEAAKLLRGSRLLTVAGVGGSGKTRLALQMASEVLDEYTDGVWLCELAPVSEPEGVIRAVAAALAVTELPGQPLDKTVIDHLRNRELLLIFDNCEHLIDAASRLTERLLASAPGLSILATSRELLGVQGEVPYQLRSMSLPDQSALFSSVVGFDSVRLFAARGEGARSGFRVDQSNAGAVVQVCRRLDGMPLAIELAAARLRVLAPEQIAARLDDRFRLLTGGSRTALPRQQTLQAAIDWSYDLLDEREKVLFDRLSAFQGGFTLEAAEAVCSVEPLTDIEILDLVSHLVDKSLVVTTEGPDGGIRYRLLETLRQYGADHLTHRGETELVRRGHLSYFHSLADKALPHLRGPDEESWLDRLEVEHDNFRHALRWAVDAGETDLGQNLAGTLYRFWMIRYHVDEGRVWLDEVLAMGQGSVGPRGRAELGAGTLAQVHSDLQSARRHLKEALVALRIAGDKVLLPAAGNNLGHVLKDLDDLTAAAALFAEELAVAEESNDLASVAFGHISIAELDLANGRNSEARDRYESALEAARSSGSKNRSEMCSAQLR